MRLEARHRLDYKGSMINIPNAITILRLLCIPIILIYLLHGYYQEALIVFILAGISDALDGFLARALKQKTLLGAIMDPIADKLLLDSIYSVAAYRQLLPDWLAIIVVSRDVFILIGFLLLSFFKKKLEVRPSLPGKLTTSTQITTVILALWLRQGVWVEIACVLTAVLTIFSGFHYLYLGLKSLSEEEINLA